MRGRVREGRERGASKGPKHPSALSRRPCYDRLDRLRSVDAGRREQSRGERRKREWQRSREKPSFEFLLPFLNVSEASRSVCRYGKSQQCLSRWAGDSQTYLSPPPCPPPSSPLLALTLTLTEKKEWGILLMLHFGRGARVCVRWKGGEQ